MITYIHQKHRNFKVCEDSLTATVFDLLKYLPSEILWSILKRSLYFQKLPEISGEILEFTYWTKWDAKETSNYRHVEPDLFIRFNEFDVIIEAKRYNENQQKEDQISNEIQAYHNEFGEENKDLYFVQVGGLLNLEEVQDRLLNGKRIVLCKSDWTKLLDQIVFEKNRIESINYSHINSYKRIFEDLIKGFEIHGFFKKLWLESLDTSFITPQSPKNLFEYATRN